MPLDILNHIIVVYSEVKPGSGEDAFAFEFDETRLMLGVFDGCGGLGFRRYEAYGGKTGAYIASRALAAETLGWFEECAPESLQERYRAAINDLASDNSSNVAIRGSMVKAFPTTASVIYANIENEVYMDVTYLWAGDSRGFLLTPSRLMQCTKDDLTADLDPFENLYEDSSLSNVVCSESSFTMHKKSLSVTYPAILISVSDGAFSYLPSPMHFEILLIETLMSSNSFGMWERALSDRISQIASDDSTLLMAVLGWRDFCEMRDVFRPRYEYLRKLKATIDFADGSRDGLRDIWLRYSKCYYLPEDKYA